MCPPRWLRPGSLGGTLGEPGERRAGAHAPGTIPGSCAGVYPTPRDFTPTRLTTALCWWPCPLTLAPDCQLLGGGGMGLSWLPRWNWCLSSSSQTVLPSSAFLRAGGIGRNWEAGSTHSLCWLRTLGCLTAKLCLTLCDPMNCTLPGSSVHKIFQAGILEWVAIGGLPSGLHTWRGWLPAQRAPH